MAKTEVLTGPTIGPDGDRKEGGASPPDTWPEWFLHDLRESGCLVQGDESPPRQRAVGAKKVVQGTSKRARRSI